MLAVQFEMWTLPFKEKVLGGHCKHLCLSAWDLLENVCLEKIGTAYAPSKQGIVVPRAHTESQTPYTCFGITETFALTEMVSVWSALNFTKGELPDGIIPPEKNQSSKW